ncbi:MAG: HD-GYP domain-containing protein [Actinomycetota bacterium]
MRDFPIRAWLYSTAVAVAAGVLVVFLARDSVRFGSAVGFGLLFLLAELAPINFPQVTYSVSFVVAVAALTGVGPAEAAIAASFGAFDLSVRSRPDWLGRMFFNGAQLTLSTAVAGIAYRTMRGPGADLNAAAFPGILIPLCVVSAAYFLVNTGLVAGMVALVRRLPMREVWRENFLSIVASTFAFAVLGVLLAVLYVQMGLAAVVFILVPLLVARSAFQAAASMGEAYEATLRSLVAAIEAKDAYTRGHAERVSAVTTMIATEMRMSRTEVHALRIAALMHDVGKLVVSTRILTKPGKLTDEEYEHMKAHPVYGREIVDDIDFLRESEAVFAVRHHHERIDGRGYPDGIAGSAIPLAARIVAAADAFDSMTSTRSYRLARGPEEALIELRRCEGTQFDPDVVRALERAIERRGWVPTVEYPGEPTVVLVPEVARA